jgi:hypothetical protein
VDVWVDDEGLEFPMEERQYQARGYRPPLPDLPWKEDYFAPPPPADDNAAPANARIARERAQQEHRTSFPERKTPPVLPRRYSAGNGMAAAATPAQRPPAARPPERTPEAEPRQSTKTDPGMPQLIEPQIIGFDE